MIKKALKKLVHALYKAGHYEHLRMMTEERSLALSAKANIDPSAWISESAQLINPSRPKDAITIGARSRIMCNMLIFDFDGSIEVGEDCFIGPDTRIWSACRIVIGDRVLIAHNVNIHDNISHPLSAQARHIEYRHFVKNGVHDKSDLRPAEVVIGNDAWIGFNTTVLKGVHIGEGAIIGADSLVTEDVEPWTVNVGNPLRMIRRLDPEAVRKVPD